MYYRKERAEKIATELKNLSIIEREKVTQFMYQKGFYLTCPEVDAKNNWESFDATTTRFTGDDEHSWFKTDIKIKEEWAGKTILFGLDFTLDEWNATGPQFLFFVNGVPYQGVDSNHSQIKLCDEAVAGQVYRVDIQAYTGKDHFRKEGADLKFKCSTKVLDQMIEQLYYHLQVPIWIIEDKDTQDQTRIEIEYILEETINLIDLREPHSEAFRASVVKAIQHIEEKLYDEKAGYSEVVATCIGHTHIDVAWWWTVEQTKEKVARSFATVLRLMEEYPEYVFMSSQPQLYQFVKERYPDMYEKIKERIAEGRWETEGAMWLESDCNLVSGESFVRQILHGKKFFKEEFGTESKMLWLPDVFGYSAALPQILKKSGVDYFMTTKISWNQYNKLPCDTFLWRGIDGSEVFTHFITTTQKKQAEGWQTTYNGMLYPKSLIYGWERYGQKEINNDILVCYGYGDGGGGANKEMLEVGKRLEKGVKGAPKVRFETAGTYFNELYDRVKDHKQLPRWVGELYFEYHRGTYTSMARNKRGNRKSELMWQDVEFFSVWAQSLGGAYPKEVITKAWEKILLNQFHDILPGTCIKDVYDVTKVDYEQLAEDGQKIIEEQLETIAAHIPAEKEDIIVFNTLSFERDDVVIVEDTEGSYVDEDGQVVETQKSADGNNVLYVKGIPAKGYKVLKKATAKQGEIPFVTTDKGIDTPFYHIQWDETFAFTSIYDKTLKRELLKANHRGNVFRAFEDKPMKWDAWDIDVYYQEKTWEIDEVVGFKWLEVGGVRATLQVERKFLSSTFIQKIHFYKETKRIDFETYVDWKQKQILVKVEFPVDVHTNVATYDIQFGNVERSTHQNTSWDFARFEVCAHKWADLSERNFGISLLNDCKYGHDIIDGNMRLTLIKSGIMPNPEADQEEHVFTYALLPHEGDFVKGQTHQEGYKLNVPVYVTKGKGYNEASMTSLVTVDRDNVIIETVKQGEYEEGTILRAYEYTNTRTEAMITWYGEVDKVYECDLMEQRLSEIEVTEGRFKIQINPYEIKTYLVKKAK
ncbi:MAG: alpha-mannosidase [Cellulosilyticaceae bacterium]